MTTRISRLLLIVVTIFVIAIVIPDFYRTSFKRSTKYKSLNYSEVTKEFLIVGSAKEPIVDAKGREYDMAGYEKLIPFSAFRSLIRDKCFPDSLDGMAMDVNEIFASNYTYKISLTDKEKYFGLLPLLQGGTEQYGYHHQGDLMRVTKNGIEFIDPTTNSVAQQKSKIFTAKAKEAGVVFPARKIWGGTSTMRERDNGIIFIDKNDNIFQVTYYAGEAICRQINTPEGFKTRRVHSVSSTEFIAYLFDHNNSIYRLKHNLTIERLPIEGFDYNNTYLIEVWGNPFYNIYSFKREGYEKLIVLDRKTNNFIDSYELKTDIYADTKAGKIEGFIYPFKITTYNFLHGYDLDIEFTSWYKFLFLNILLAVALYFMKKREGLDLKNIFNRLDIAMVAIFGIFAFIGIMVFPTRK